jgi:rare lipoprotein A
VGNILKVKLGFTLLCLSVALIVPVQASFAATVPEIDPEIAANSWAEDEVRFASVTLNGKEIIRLKESSDSSRDEALVEDISARFDALVKEGHFDPEKILPAREGDMIALRIDGTTLVRIPAQDLVDGSGKPMVGSTIEQGLKIANAIRSSFGVGNLPQTFIKLAELASQDSGSGSKGVGHFSGPASWYGPKFNGRKTSDGSTFDQEGLTAAHRSLPFGTKLLVMNRKTGESCVVKVNDRGPFVDGRVIDLSKGAAKQLNMLGSGVATVDCLVLEQP